MICDIAFVILWEIPERKGFRCLETLYKQRTLFAEDVIYATVKTYLRHTRQAILYVIFFLSRSLIGTNENPTF